MSLLLNASDELRSAIADILETQTFVKNDYIFREGQQAEHFFFVQKGEAIVTLKNSNKVLRTLRCGDFFGERALLLNDVRSANVIVTSDKMDVVGMDNASFMRLLGPLYDTFRQNFKSYTMNVVEQQDDDGAISDIE